jgi:hypothetical protein
MSTGLSVSNASSDISNVDSSLEQRIIDLVEAITVLDARGALTLVVAGRIARESPYSVDEVNATIRQMLKKGKLIVFCMENYGQADIALKYVMTGIRKRAVMKKGCTQVILHKIIFVLSLLIRVCIVDGCFSGSELFLSFSKKLFLHCWLPGIEKQYPRYGYSALL